jgi:hypothetical protein
MLMKKAGLRMKEVGALQGRRHIRVAGIGRIQRFACGSLEGLERLHNPCPPGLAKRERELPGG